MIPLPGQQRNEFLDFPDVIGRPGFHRGRDAQRLVNPAEVVVHEVERHVVREVLGLFREGTEPRDVAAMISEPMLTRRRPGRARRGRAFQFSRDKGGVWPVFVEGVMSKGGSAFDGREAAWTAIR